MPPIRISDISLVQMKENHSQNTLGQESRAKKVRGQSESSGLPILNKHLESPINDKLAMYEHFLNSAM